MTDTTGIDELKLMINSVGALSAFLVSRLKDGLDMGDAVALVTKLTSDPSFLGNIEAAVKGINQVPAEVKDLNFAEGIELAQLMYAQVQAILAARAV